MIDGCGRLRALIRIRVYFDLAGFAATYNFASCRRGYERSARYVHERQVNYTIPVALNYMC
jgi:hypothetical protein